MIFRLEIRLKTNLADAEGTGIKKKAKDYFGIQVDEIRVVRVLMIDAGLTSEQMETARSRIFTNPITEESSFKPLAQDFDWLIWVGYRPGVRDTAGSTAVEAVEHLNPSTGECFDAQDDSEQPEETYPQRNQIRQVKLLGNIHHSSSKDDGRDSQFVGDLHGNSLLWIPAFVDRNRARDGYPITAIGDTCSFICV